MVSYTERSTSRFLHLTFFCSVEESCQLLQRNFKARYVEVDRIGTFSEKLYILKFRVMRKTNQSATNNGLKHSTMHVSISGVF